MEGSTTSAAIVAGGRARRFSGQDKSRLVVEGRTIIVRQVEILQRVAREVFIVGSDPERYRDLALPVHADALPGSGALGGIHTALATATSDLVLVVACDMPFLHAGLLEALTMLAAGRDGAWVKTARGVEPLLACYRTSAEPLVRARIHAGLCKASDLSAILDLAEIGPDKLQAFGPVDRLLANVNTPEDYARVQYGAS